MFHWASFGTMLGLGSYDAMTGGHSTGTWFISHLYCLLQGVPNFQFVKFGKIFLVNILLFRIYCDDDLLNYLGHPVSSQ